MQIKNFPSPSIVDDQNLTDEEEFEIAGYNPEASELIEQEYLIQREGEAKEPQSSSENPLVRFVVMAMLVGGMMLFGLMVWALFFSSKPISPRVVTTPSPSFAPLESDEASQLKAQLAFRDQSSRLEKQQSAASVPASVTQPSTPQRSAARITSAPASSPRIVRVSAPPRIIRESVPVRATTFSPQIQPKPTPVQSPTVDPLERWNQLATVGQQTAMVTATEQPSATGVSSSAASTPPRLSNSSVAPASSSSSATTRSSTLPSASTQSNSSSPQPTVIPLVSVGGSESVVAQETRSQLVRYSAGEQGILSHTATNTPAFADAKPMQVRLGTSAVAKVVVPMVWAGSNASSQQSSQKINSGRFAVELTEDVLSTDGRVALPKGTVLITEVDTVASNKLVYQSVVAVIYTTRTGEIRQQTIPKDSVLIRGEGNQPLIARRLNTGKGAAIAKQDILVGLLGAVGQIGEAVNRPRSQFSSVTNGGGFNQTISTISNREPNLIAAAAEGFFKPTSKRLGQRADETTQEILSQPNVLVVPQGTPVSIFFNTFFQVVP